MKLIITNLPSFYKIKLFNEINKKVKLKVFYTGHSPEQRNKDFFDEVAEFDSDFLFRKSKLSAIIRLIKIIFTTRYDELMIGGWDEVYFWIAAFLSPKKKNSMVVESSYLESKTTGAKGFIKKIILKRISKVYASGSSQEKLVRDLGYSKNVIITKGVGIFNYHAQPQFLARHEVKNFLFVGRLSPEKNLEYLIGKFNNHPELHLDIIGFGPEEDKLKSIAGANTRFLGAVNNKDLAAYYQQSDVFILPSKSEPWGLVVEEAFNNGIPVMVSNHVGCADEIVNKSNGVIFSLDEDDFEEKLNYITNIDNYNSMRKSISLMDFDAIEKYQVSCYLK